MVQTYEWKISPFYGTSIGAAALLPPKRTKEGRAGPFDAFGRLVTGRSYPLIVVRLELVSFKSHIKQAFMIAFV